MAWTGPGTRAPGDVITASIWNTDLVNNLTYLKTVTYATLIDIVSSVTETNILQSAGYSIAGNMLGATGGIHVKIIGDYLNNTGGGVASPAIKIKWGGTTVWQSLDSTLNSATIRRPFRIDFILTNRNATNSQALIGHVIWGSTVSAPTTGIGGVNTFAGGAQGYWHDVGLASDPAKDTTSAQTIAVTATLASSSASHELRVFSSAISFL